MPRAPFGSLALTLCILMSLPACASATSPGGMSGRGVLCPSAHPELRRAVCEDDDLRAMDREMLRLVLLYRRSAAIRQALEASERVGEPPVAPPWPRPTAPASATGGSGLEALAQQLAWLQSEWQRQEGLPDCFEAKTMPGRRLCLLSLYTGQIHQLRRLGTPSMVRAMDGASQGPFWLQCEGFVYPLVMTRVSGAHRWLFLEWVGDHRAPEIGSPLLLREESQVRSVDGWRSRYTRYLPPDVGLPVAVDEYSLQLESAGTAVLTAGAADSGGLSRRCGLKSTEP